MTKTALTMLLAGLLLALCSGPVLAATSATSGADSLRGTRIVDDIRGLGGDDTLTALAGNDTVRGDGGRDLISGGTGNDTIFGGTGDDASRHIFAGLSGGAGNDRVYGGGGNDYVIGDTGRDLLSGGAGDDYIASTSGESYDEPTTKDTIYCGPGLDTVSADAADYVAPDCEDVTRF